MIMYHNGVVCNDQRSGATNVKLFKTLLNPFTGNSRFDRYYGNVLRQGEGYPTADEARKDLRNQELNKNLVGWMR